jgi:N-acetylglucosamine-6-phosphate deacetylase
MITDGAHVHPAAAALAFRAAPHRCILVTDAMPALGAGLGPTRYGDLPVMIHAGVEAGDGTYPGVHAVVAGTSTLAGAVAPLDRCLRNLAAAVGIDARALAPPAAGGSGADRSAPAVVRDRTLKALRAVGATVTSNPARCLGLQHVIGSLQPGCFGDAVLLDPATLAVDRVFLGGRLSWSRADTT